MNVGRLVLCVLALVACKGSNEALAPEPCKRAADQQGNLVPNGSFDVGSQGWTGGSATSTALGDDAAGCSASRSLLLAATPTGETSKLFGQSASSCFTLPATKRYSFQATMKRVEAASVSCFLLVWDNQASCEQMAEGSRRLESIDNGLSDPGRWDRVSANIDGTAAAVARVNCRTDGTGYVDEVFFGPAVSPN